MLTALKNNFGLKLLSLGLAVAALAYFHLAAAPGTIARFDQTLSVPIVVSGLRPGYTARYADKVATVVVEVPRNGTPLKADQIQAVLDLSEQSEPGYHNVPVKIVAPDVAIRSLSPASVTLSLDRLVDRTIPVSVDYVGNQHGLVVESVRVTPSATTIRGVASDLSKVTAVRVEIPIPPKPGWRDEMIAPIPSDARGADVQSVDVSPNLVRVQAHFVAPGGAAQQSP